MSRFATRASTRAVLRRLRALGREPRRGSTLPVVMGLTAILAVVAVTSLTYAQGSTSSAARQGRGDVAIQAADAGVNRYVSRLVEDPRYFDHFVDQAEDPRIDPTGLVHPPGSPWTAGTPWTYAGPTVTQVPLQDARFGRATYSLRITPPPVGSDVVTVVSSARVDAAGDRPQIRTVQAQVLPTSIADFQMISNKEIKYGATATTTGKLYSAVSVNHLGVARAPVYGQDKVCSEPATIQCAGHYYGADRFQAGAYDAASTPSFSDKFSTPIDFSQFTRAINDIKDAAMHGGVYRNDPTVNAWMVQFRSDGTARIWRAVSPDIRTSVTSLSCPETVAVPGNGAMFFEQPVIVSDGGTVTDACGSSGPRPSVVDGRVTLATPGDLIIGGNITYETGTDDVLGLIATQSIVFAKYTPVDTTVRAATLAQNGQWITAATSRVWGHNTLTYIGSQTTNQGGYASMFANRTYNYDSVLQFLRPPFYPIIEGSWSIRYWREVSPPS
ncbi:MAG: pilus assembly PilX N-terminal domain-containing protein [Actinomycetota bacterium]